MDEFKKLKRILPLTPWSARSFWSFETKPILVLCISLMFFGIGEGMLVTAGIGSAPWTVLAQGLSLQSGLNIGIITFLISTVLLVLWIPLKQRFGLGTVLNMLVIAVVLGLYVRYIPQPTHIAMRILLCIGGILVIGTASAFYLTCHLGAGARDGLMVGLCSLSGWRIGWVRTALEGSVCLVGWLLGGTVGVGTILFAFGVGWVVQTALGLIEKLPVRQAV